MGPIQALVDELEYNGVVGHQNEDWRLPKGGRGAPFMDDQFRNAVRAGAVSMLPDSVKAAIYAAYAATAKANRAVEAEVAEWASRPGMGTLRKPAEEAVAAALPAVDEALSAVDQVLAGPDGA